MTRDKAIQAWKCMRNEIDNENWLFVGTINPQMVDMAIEALQTKAEWVPVKWHEITDEEREREGYPKDWVVHIDCEMPCDEQEILVQTKSSYIRWDVCYEDGEFSLDSGWDWVEDIVAWMPLPKPYREDGE